MRRTFTTESAAEFAVVAHLRGMCHDGRACTICRAYTAGQRDAVDKVAAG